MNEFFVVDKIRYFINRVNLYQSPVCLMKITSKLIFQTTVYMTFVWTFQMAARLLLFVEVDLICQIFQTTGYMTLRRFRDVQDAHL